MHWICFVTLFILAGGALVLFKIRMDERKDKE